MVRVDILLPTYRGAAYLPEQLDSILAQTHVDWVIRWSDDGSTDETVAVMERYTQNHPGRFFRCQSGEKLGSTRHFLYLLTQAEADWVMLCDQDDVWFPHKIAQSLSCVANLSTKQPTLVFTDMSVTDARLNVQKPSFYRAQKLQPEKVLTAGIAAVCAQSIAAGCTMLLNRAAIDSVPRIGDYPYQHDHWILIHVLDAGGDIRFFSEPTMYYRQHGLNEVGAQTVNWQYLKEKFFSKQGFWAQWRKGVPSLRKPPSRWAVLWNKLKINLNRW